MSIKEKVLNLQLEKAIREKDHYEEQVKNHEILILAYESGKKLEDIISDGEGRTTSDSLNILKSTVDRLEKDLQSQISYSDELLALVETEDNDTEVDSKVEELREAKNKVSAELVSVKELLNSKDTKISELVEKVNSLTKSLEYERNTLIELQERQARDIMKVEPITEDTSEVYKKQLEELKVKYEKEVQETQLSAVKTIQELKNRVKELENTMSEGVSLPHDSVAIDRLTKENLDLQEKLERTKSMLELKDKEIEELKEKSDMDKYLELEAKYEAMTEKYNRLIGEDLSVDNKDIQNITEIEPEEIIDKKKIFQKWI